MKLSDVRLLQKDLSRIATILEAVEVFEGTEAERKVFDRQAKSAIAAFAKAVAAAGVTAAPAKREFKTTPAVKKWRSERMKLFAQTQKHAKGSAEHIAASEAYIAWMAQNPAPGKK
jgi:hypothetical protein